MPDHTNHRTTESRARWAGVDGFLQDLRDALRALRHARSYTAWVVGSLAIGIAVTISALALLNASMVLPFPQVTDQKHLVRLSVSRTCGRPDCLIRMSAPADYEALREGLSGLQGMAAYTSGEVAVALPEARSMRALVTSPNYFDVLGVTPAVGRAYGPADQAGDGAVAMIGHSAWMREFNGDPTVVGRSIRVADRFVHIVGVAPEGFIGLDRIRPGGGAPDLWLPLWLADRVLPLTSAERRRQERDLAFVGRLRHRVDLTTLRSEAGVVAHRLAASRGDGQAAGRAEVDRVWRVRPESWQYGVLIVMPIPILVLTIACVNAANLMLARGSQRRRDIAVRLALGAGRRRIVRQLLIESAGLAALATAIAVPIAAWSLRLAGTPLGERIPIDPLVLALTVLTAAVTTVAFGLAPALRISAQPPSVALEPANGRGAVPRQSRTGRVLIVTQVALSLGLLVTAWQLVGTVRAQAVSGGTPADRLLVARFDLQPLGLAPAEIESFYRELMAGASRLAGAQAAGVSRHTAVWTFGQRTTFSSLRVWGPSDAREEGRTISGGYAGGDLFGAVGLRTVAGRGFTEADRQGPPRVAVVNESAAKAMGGPAIGSLLRVARPGDGIDASFEVRVVGVIEASREPRLELDGSPSPKIYLPSPLDAEPALSLYLRSAGAATALAQPLRDLVGRIAPRVPIVDLGSLDQLNERSYATQLWLARAAALIGAIGLVLATAGLYGVASYVVTMRSREIAIRMAIGARPRMILGMILGESMRLAAVGLVIGGGTALAVSRWIQSEYHGIQGFDFLAFAGAAVLFLGCMLLAGALPAMRAARLDPVANLKDG